MLRCPEKGETEGSAEEDRKDRKAIKISKTIEQDVTRLHRMMLQFSGRSARDWFPFSKRPLFS
jgi:hypothetical protein